MATPLHAAKTDCCAAKDREKKHAKMFRHIMLPDDVSFEEVFVMVLLSFFLYHVGYKNNRFFQKNINCSFGRPNFQ